MISRFGFIFGALTAPVALAAQDEFRTVMVREARAELGSRMIPIRYLLLRAIDNPAAPPLIVVNGGPGFAGTEDIRRFKDDSVLRKSRDIILFDQRGTGGSNRLSCDVAGPIPRVRDALFPVDFIQRCRDSLSRIADIAAYTTAASVHDIESIRADLGASLIDLFGISYGTRLAQSYATTFPSRVRRISLDGVVPVNVIVSAEAATHIENAIAKSISDCEQSECRLAFPNLRAAWSKAHTLFPVGSSERWRLAYALRGSLYSGAARIPALIASAVAGDFAEVDSTYARRAAFVSNATGTGLHLTVNCSEDIPNVPPAEASRLSAGTLMADMYHSQYRSACTVWGVPRIPVPHATSHPSAIEALLLSGEYDPVTPAEYANRTAQNFTVSRHVVFSRTGHAPPSKCKSRILAAFHDGAAVRAIDAECASLTPL